MKKEYIIGGIIGIIIALALVAFVGYTLGKKSQRTVSVGQPVADTKEAVVPSVNDGEVPPIISSAFGTLREIKDNGELVIETFISSPVSSLPEEPTVKTEMVTVSTGPDTEFVQVRYISSSSGPSMEEKKVSLSDLKVGDQVSVTSADSIEGKKAFAAVRVQQSVIDTENPASD